MANRRPKVFVVNRSGHDYSAAKKYGDLVFVTEGRQNRFSVNTHGRSWAESLRDSGPDDLIILSSMNVLCSIGCALFASMHGCLNVLMFRNGKYVKRELSMKELMATMGFTPEWTE